MKEDCNFTKPVIEINNPEQLILFRKVVVPASLGDETDVPPVIGKYRNVLLEYEKSDNVYLYSSDGIPTKLNREGPQVVVNDATLTIKSGDDVAGTFTANSATDTTITLPAPATVNDATLTIQNNGTLAGTFTANSATDTTINITSPQFSFTTVDPGEGVPLEEGHFIAVYES